MNLNRETDQNPIRTAMRDTIQHCAMFAANLFMALPVNPQPWQTPLSMSMELDTTDPTIDICQSLWLLQSYLEDSGSRLEIDDWALRGERPTFRFTAKVGRISTGWKHDHYDVLSLSISNHVVPTDVIRHGALHAYVRGLLAEKGEYEFDDLLKHYVTHDVDA